MNINQCSHESMRSIAPITSAPTRMWACDVCGDEFLQPVTEWERKVHRR